MIELFNGEMGFVYYHGLDKKSWTFSHWLRRFTVTFKGKENYSVEYGTAANSKPVDNLELAYAISVHKSQGSDFATVYVVIPQKRNSLLSMELLYTAVTRAQKKLVLFLQEDISTVASLAKVERSAVRRINSSVFEFKPIPIKNIMFMFCQSQKVTPLRCLSSSKSAVLDVIGDIMLITEPNHDVGLFVIKHLVFCIR